LIQSFLQNNEVLTELQAALNHSDSTDSDDEDDNTTLDPPEPAHVCVAHGVAWEAIPDGMAGHSINGEIPYKEWGLRLPTGDIWRDGDNIDESVTRLEVFLQMFPKMQLNDTFILTNVQLRKKGLRETTKSELIKFFGIMILTTIVQTYGLNIHQLRMNRVLNWDDELVCPAIGLMICGPVLGYLCNQMRDLKDCHQSHFAGC
jgi:hypothetical protein